MILISVFVINLVSVLNRVSKEKQHPECVMIASVRDPIIIGVFEGITDQEKDD